MTRKIPWLQGTATKGGKSRGVASDTTPRVRKPRRVYASSDVEAHGEEDTGSVQEPDTSGRHRSASPAPSVPEESLMKDGFGQDDQFRMVEDEFLDAAKEFTQHLHAAEYQRMRREAKSQKAATINSISRPVTIKMPDQTHRKVEGIARSKKQSHAVHSILGKHNHGTESDDDSAGEDNSFVGTALHGLMDSPRKSAASLAKIGAFAASTRAAMGFKKSHTATEQSPQKPSNKLHSGPLSKSERQSYQETDITSDDEDDDLDAPTRPLNLKARKLSTPVIKLDDESVKRRRSGQPAKVTQKEHAVSLSCTPKTESSTSADVSSRIARRRDQLHAQRLKEEEEENSKKRKRLDVIPTFL